MLSYNKEGVVPVAGKDLMEKTLESYNDVFADIVNALIFEGRQVVSEHELTDAQPTTFYKTDGRLREQERDCSKYWNRARVRIALFGMENQTDYDPRMPLRVLGYDGAAYRAQLDEKALYPVVTLVLYFGNAPWGSRTLHQALDLDAYPPEIRSFTSDYRINVFEIARLTDEQIDRFHSDFRIVADYFAHRRADPDYRPTDLQRFVHVNELLKLMSAVTHDDRYEQTINAKGGAPRNMDELLNRIEARGETRGIAIGEQRGISIGTLNAKKADALAIRDTWGITDAEQIAKAIGIEAELVERWFEENPS